MPHVITQTMLRITAICFACMLSSGCDNSAGDSIDSESDSETVSETGNDEGTELGTDESHETAGASDDETDEGADDTDSSNAVESGSESQSTCEWFETCETCEQFASCEKNDSDQYVCPDGSDDENVCIEAFRCDEMPVLCLSVSEACSLLCPQMGCGLNDNTTLNPRALWCEVE